MIPALFLLFPRLLAVSCAARRQNRRDSGVEFRVGSFAAKNSSTRCQIYCDSTHLTCPGIEHQITVTLLSGWPGASEPRLHLTQVAFFVGDHRLDSAESAGTPIG